MRTKYLGFYLLAAFAGMLQMVSSAPVPVVSPKLTAHATPIDTNVTPLALTSERLAVHPPYPNSPVKADAEGRTIYNSVPESAQPGHSPYGDSYVPLREGEFAEPKEPTLKDEMTIPETVNIRPPRPIQGADSAENNAALRQFIEDAKRIQ